MLKPYVILAPIIYVATAIGGCNRLGASCISRGAVGASKKACAAMGGRINANNQAILWSRLVCFRLVHTWWHLCKVKQSVVLSTY